ncbi:DUF393 domain-containing protein [Methylobacterium radiodurans]|uniref:DUF393 domain-containing protein n=1 Tax=Methylobacterium radiodurans TaxID=2202828 RepID=A0A2U8W188_9HYPH|nr:DUF393 domain-containing protein [Methylobacterium radiodurans]AWN39212.1 DUF393 domain-containing protein [Methylobacterium radiodurans]
MDGRGPEHSECGNESTVYFDGACPLCRAEIDHYRRSRGAERIAFVDVSRCDTVEQLGPDLSQEAALRRFHLRDRDGQLISGAAAFARLWTLLPGWRWLGRLITFRFASGQPMLRVAEFLYRASLPLRPRLARILQRLRLI